MSEGLTHVRDDGSAAMVDVSDKPSSDRRAVASATVELSPSTVRRIAADDLPKNDVLATVRLAGINATKQTHLLIPLCHPLRIDAVAIDVELDQTAGECVIRAEVAANDRTGVEMEALTAASVAALTLYDMVKAVDRGAVIRSVQLEHKSGGRSGEWNR